MSATPIPIERSDLQYRNFIQPEMAIPTDVSQFGDVQRQRLEIPGEHATALKIAFLEDRIRRLEKTSIGFIKINLLPTKSLKRPLDAVVELDGADGFIAKTTDLPLFGIGDDPLEATEMLKREIESLYEDLSEDDSFSEDWLRVKRFLNEIIFS